jgi:hypothetical protein
MSQETTEGRQEKAIAQKESLAIQRRDPLCT